MVWSQLLRVHGDVFKCPNMTPLILEYPLLTVDGPMGNTMM